MKKELEVTREELAILSKEELLDVVEQLQKEVVHWKHRFQCADKERELVYWKHKVPTV